MQYLNEKLWKSAYLIEFHKNGNLQDAFAFSVPPQSEEFIFSQRINETKTFGGSVIDDYGNDTVKISLAGTTINQSLKIIYQGNKGQKFLSGQDEIFYLRDLLKKYGDFSNLQGKEVFLYSLDNGKKGSGAKNPKAWQIFVTDFTVRRSKDMPFTYFYTLNAIGCPMEISSKNKILELLKKNKKLNNLVEKFKSFNEFLKEKLPILQSYLGYIEEFSELVSIVSTNVEDVSTNLSNYMNLLTGSIESISNVVSEVVALHDTVLESTLKLWPTNLCTQLFNSTSKLVQSCIDMRDWWDNFVHNNVEYEKICSNFKIAQQDLYDKGKKLFNGINKHSNALAKAVNININGNSVDGIVKPGTENEDDSLIIINGYKEYSFKSSDTWASISQKYYGTPDYASIIQLYNDHISLENLEVGAIVYIPNINSSSNYMLEANEVYHEPGIKDIYGQDFKIVNGDFNFKNGDLEKISGVNNLNQAILNRLTTTINSRVRNVVYGIRNEVGVPSISASAISSYITSSIEQTILADPRVDSIESLTWESKNGEQLQVNVVYNTVVGGVKNLSALI